MRRLWIMVVCVEWQDGLKTSFRDLCIVFSMNIYSALRSRDSKQRTRLIGRVRKYVPDPAFHGVLSRMNVDDIASIRRQCGYLRAWDNDLYIRSKIIAWLRS
jgi:hypothetical protein